LENNKNTKPGENARGVTSFEYYMLVETKTRSKETRDQLKMLKKELLSERLLGKQLDLKARIKNCRFYLSLLPDNSFIKKRALSLAKRDDLVQQVELVVKTCPYDFKWAERIYNESISFIQAADLSFFELTRLASMVRRL
jgi:hypothetical protein